MESQCDYSMIFPACPVLPADLPGRYRTLPRRNHLYLGETLRFLLVLRLRSGGEAGQDRAGSEALCQESPGTESCSWAPLAASLSALASVCPGEEEPEKEDDESGGEHTGGAYRGCRAILSQQRAPGGSATGTPVTDPVVSSDEVIFPLSVSLDRLPPTTVKAKMFLSILCAAIGLTGSLFCLVMCVVAIHRGPVCGYIDNNTTSPSTTENVNLTWGRPLQNPLPQYNNENYIYHKESWSICVEPPNVVEFNLILFSIMLAASAFEIVLCTVQLFNGLFGVICGTCKKDEVDYKDMEKDVSSYNSKDSDPICEKKEAKSI